MTKKNRLRKAWQRNWKLWTIKGIYFCAGQPIKNWMTPRQLLKYLKRED